MADRQPAGNLAKCPSCGRPASRDAAECPACGLVFAKWQARQNQEKLERLQRAEKEEREKREAMKALDVMDEPRAKARDPRAGRLIAAALVVLWMLGLALYYRGRLPALRAAAELSAPAAR